MRFVERRAAEGGEIIDPLAETLKGLKGVDAFLALEQVFPRALVADPTWREAVEAAYTQFA
jgi:fructuronate reductase